MSALPLICAKPNVRRHPCLPPALGSELHCGLCFCQLVLPTGPKTLLFFALYDTFLSAWDTSDYRSAEGIPTYIIKT